MFPLILYPLCLQLDNPLLMILLFSGLHSCHVILHVLCTSLFLLPPHGILQTLCISFHLLPPHFILHVLCICLQACMPHCIISLCLFPSHFILYALCIFPHSVLCHPLCHSLVMLLWLPSLCRCSPSGLIPSAPSAQLCNSLLTLLTLSGLMGGLLRWHRGRSAI